MSDKKHRSGKELHLCALEKKKKELPPGEDLDEREAAYICRKCKRAAEDKKFLCKPERASHPH